MIKKLTFTDLKLTPELLKAVSAMGFEEASPIQAEAIPLIREGKDIIGQAMTGSGKTAAFAIPIIENIVLTQALPQALILCPTRELAIQVAGEFNKLALFRPHLSVVPIYGGQPIERQFAALRKGVHIVIGTPGRIIDHLSRRTLSLKMVKTVVLDEADEMLDMGFRDDIERILQATPPARQTLLFSATMPPAIVYLARTYQKNPVAVRVQHEKITAPAIEQFYFEIESHKKLDLLTRIFELYNPQLTIIFCNTRRRVDDVVTELHSRGYAAEGIHGDIMQQKRTRVMDRFRRGEVDILVATDVAARGIDVSNVEAVINFEIPQDDESYVHRIGRTGRAGKTGKAFSLVSGRDMYRFRDIRRYTKAVITRLPVPSFEQVEEAKTSKLVEQIRSVIQAKHLEKQTQVIEKLLKEDITSVDVAAALLKMYLSKKSK
jgi:ATP-dependent RNA helicase DeaD